MQNNYSFSMIYFAMTGILFFSTGCHWGNNSPSITEKFSDTKFISKVTGRSKKDELIIKKYQDLLDQNKKPEKKEFAQNSSPEVSNGNNIQQANYEALSVDKSEFDAANNALMQRKYPEAARLYKMILAKDPTNQMVHHRLAIISDELKDFTAAEFHYMTALLTKPNDTNLISDLGYSYLLQGKYHKSEEFLKKAIVIDPNHVRAIDNLGYLYGKQSRFDLAITYFRKTGSEIEAQRKIQQVKSELGNPTSQYQTQTVNNQLTKPNLNQEEFTEISPGPIPNNSQSQQTYGKPLQAPNPITVPGLVSPKNHQYQSTVPHQGQPIQGQSSTYATNQHQHLPSGNGQVRNQPRQMNIEHYQGGKLIKPGDVNATHSRNSRPGSQAPLKSGHSIHSLPPEESWPPASQQVPQSKTSTRTPLIKTTTYHPQNSTRINQAIYSYPQGQKPNNISSIPTQYSKQNVMPIQQAAAIMGMNTGPGGMFPVMNQTGMNQQTTNQQRPGQSIQGNRLQTDASIQQQLQNPINRIQNWSQNQTLQNQPSQQGNYYQNQSRPTSNGMEVNRGHHLMRQSPLQIFEQKYYDDLEKSKSNQQQ